MKIEKLDLDYIISCIFDKLSENREFDFVKLNEKEFENKLIEYTKDIIRAELKDEKKAIDAVENFSDELLSEFSRINISYFKLGLKFLTNLIIQLTS